MITTYSGHADEDTEQLGLFADGPKTPNSIFCREDIWPCIKQVMSIRYFFLEFMAYLIHGHISYRQKIELGLLGSSAIKPRCSVYSSPCPEYVGTNLSFGRNYWGKYGHFVLFAIRVNKSVAIVFLITCFLQHARMYSISTLSKFQVIYPKRS